MDRKSKQTVEAKCGAATQVSKPSRRNRGEVLPVAFEKKWPRVGGIWVKNMGEGMGGGIGRGIGENLGGNMGGWINR